MRRRIFSHYTVRALSVAGLAAFGLAAFGLVAAAPAHADWHHDRHWHRDHFGVGLGVGIYAPPPVVYAPPVYYAPPPVYYAPPAVSLGFRFGR
jgi:4-amino-4-deoxy-L-arabinose transferase-like glycosyltransferase